MTPTDLSGVTFVTAPGRFPRRPFALVRDAGFVPESLGFIRPFAPDVPYHGTVPADAPLQTVPAAADLVVSSDHWYDAVTDLLARGVPPGRITVLLNPFNDEVGYLEIARTCPDHVAELVDPAVPVARKIALLRPHLLRFGAARRFDGDAVVWDPEHYFLPYQQLVRDNAAAVHDVTAALADPASREAYQTVLYGRPEELLTHFLGRVFHEQQYVEVPSLKPGDVIVNAGIATGWDVPYLVAGTRGVGRHILLDPLPALTAEDGPCGRLVKRLGLEYVGCGLWDQTDELTFQADEYGMLHTGTNTLPAGAPVHRAQLRRLDDLAGEWKLDRLDLLKMDIEGADLRALSGMRATLTRLRPQIAVCIYHSPDHMWLMPRLLMDLLPNYRFYVRHYSYTRFECLLYGIPEERLPAAPPDRSGGFDEALRAATCEKLMPGEPRAAEAALDAAFARSDIGQPTPTVEIEVGRERFLGTGWGVACQSRTQTWRWVGPDGEAGVYLTLDPTKDHLCRFYFHHVETQAGFDAARLEVNGMRAAGREIGKSGDYHYAQWRIPAAAAVRTGGRCRLRFTTAPGPRQVAVSAVHCWQAG
ncbi:FkbM family methyltransferase [Urbifossiella limnaea]|uniref:Methyltransferase FkbM domain-containing protein n=1 Tax=Urbifossiella limnaea TaxID=2528023 RepID=A0A517XLW3_9BACT|nr:FkbM family methyltransferase [Urbifossiella limnaea]QDU18489.1 hypothetical protein ETAA1_03770 [Urbifossiella limnaea]